MSDQRPVLLAALRSALVALILVAVVIGAL